MNCNTVYDYYKCMKLRIYTGCGMSYASSHMNYKQRMIKNTKTFLMLTLDHLEIGHKKYKNGSYHSKAK